jgi:hypothetical protein
VKMEPETKKSVSSLIKMMLIILIVLALIVLAYMILSIIGIRKKIESINDEFGIVLSTENTVEKKLYGNPEFLNLQKEKSFLQAQIIMAESDSICLSINLRDSVAALQINGAAVHSAKISEIRMSSIFRKVNEYAITGMLSSPFEVRESYSTIKKEPIMIKMAPKDTIEANVPNILPDTSSLEPVNFILEMNYGVKLYVYQEENDKSSDRRNLFLFDLIDRLRYARVALRTLINFKMPEYQPYIKIRIPKDDAKIIFRAIARQGLVAVFI